MMTLPEKGDLLLTLEQASKHEDLHLMQTRKKWKDRSAKAESTHEKNTHSYTKLVAKADAEDLRRVQQWDY